jgi:hypothetical protein
MLIHQNQMAIDYITPNLEKDLNSIKVAIEKVYQRLLKHYGWQAE